MLVFDLDVPCNRTSSFEPVRVKKHKTHPLDQTILSLYALFNSYSQISEHIDTKEKCASYLFLLWLYIALLFFVSSYSKLTLLADSRAVLVTSELKASVPNETTHIAKINKKLKS